MPSSPLDAVLREPITTIVLWLSVALAVAGLIWSLRILRREGDPIPLFLGVGGAVTCLLGPLFDITAAIANGVCIVTVAMTAYQLRALFRAGWRPCQDAHDGRRPELPGRIDRGCEWRLRNHGAFRHAVSFRTGANAKLVVKLA